MKKLTILFLLLILTLPFTFTTCTEAETDNENQEELQELTLDKSEVSLLQGKTTTVNILTGNGEYKVTSSNESVANIFVSGNVITISATTQVDKAEAIIIVTDKKSKRATIDVKISKLFDLTLDKNSVALEVGSQNNNEVTITIKEGNSGYQTELLNNSAEFIAVDAANIESSGKFTIKAISEGSAHVKVTDSRSKEAIVEVTVTAFMGVTTNKTSISLTAVQESEVITVLTGNGNYKAIVSDPLIVKASVSMAASTTIVW
ncbi:hypothetical protein EZS27_036064 [termite gut metagenome]|uniref:Uncharacterized protein n=1 Tax=termite gut metagenome TaxID=433724 RepID=A0A5J4PWV8_9ZZZZ